LRSIFITLFCLVIKVGFSQEVKQDTIPPVNDTLKAAVVLPVNEDSVLRIVNLNPYFTLQVDSVLIYDLQINKPSENYYWYLKNRGYIPTTHNHYLEDAAKVWVDVLYNYIQENNLI
jgi:hypothetical protein